MELDKKSQASYELVPRGNNIWELHYKGYVPQDPKSGTVKLQVFLNGNQTDKANATLSLKVNIR